MKMTWEEKLSACCSIADTSLSMRKPGDWYVSSGMEVIERGHRGVLVGSYGNGKTPEEAVENHWKKLVENPEVECIVVHAMRDDRRELIWNGFMWQDYHGAD